MMKKHIFLKTLLVSASCLAAASCSGWLDLRPTGAYNDDNVGEYPSFLRGYVEKAYDLAIGSSSYLSYEYTYLDAATDDAIFSDASAQMRQFSSGTPSLSFNPLSDSWNRDYEAIRYVNMFLKDDVGYNTRYLVDDALDRQLREYLQGDAYALRAWCLFDLLKKFGGLDEKGSAAGVCIVTEPFEYEELTGKDLVRASFDDCMAQIIADCDSALAHLPLANRDFALGDDESEYVGGGIRYKALDRISVKLFLAEAYLMWASPAFNSANDLSRYRKAASLAAEVIKYKLEVEGPEGFSPVSRVVWTDKNSPEIIWRHTTDSKLYETYFYPSGFGGNATVVPTQNLVDAFPMANGYPITDSRSGYDESQPYEGRDPRFYSDIFYNGSSVLRNGSATAAMYTFDMTKGGKDAPGAQGTSCSGYYIKKFLYNGWNPFDETVSSQTRCVFALRWSHALLVFAEAAGAAYGPQDASLGLSARDALAYIRSRNTDDNEKGLGASGDPYLDECAGDAKAFETLVRNEWRVETCFEGTRFFNLRRWSKDLSAINVPVYGALYNSPGYVRTDNLLTTLSFPSLWMPIPYEEFRKTDGQLTQNAGWESWK